MRLPLVRAVSVLLVTSVIGASSLFATAADAPTNSPSPKERRLALVIGNSDYAFAPLRNSLNDATDFASALKDSGFEVTMLRNANLRDTRNALRDFGDRLKGQGGVGLFYFAGHGMQVKGRNYLIPVGAQIEREDEVEFESLDANQVLEKLDSAGNRFNIVILDACRNNPFARSFRSSTQGLAQMDAPSGAVVAFATSPGSVASDGAGRNGLYTQYLIENVQRPGLKIEEVFKQVRASVRRDSNGQQTPWESTSLEGDFYFHPVDRAAMDAARRQQEQARIEEAVRVAIANERTRLIKEYEQAMGRPAPEAPPAQSVNVAAVSAPAPAAVTVAEPPKPVPSAPPPESAAIVVASNAPKASPSNTTTIAAKADGVTTESGQVIGARLGGAIPAPVYAVGDEWEFLTITSNPLNPGADPATVIDKFTAVNYVPGGRLGLFREALDKPGGAAITTGRTYFVNAELESAFFEPDAISGQRKMLIFPFNPPDRWSYSYEFPTNRGTGKSRDDLDSKVAGWELVTVPAGTFWAVKVEQKGWRNNLSPDVISWARQATRLEFTFWYSPETKSIIQLTRKQFPSSVSLPGGLANLMITEQLIRFTSAESKATASAAK